MRNTLKFISATCLLCLVAGLASGKTLAVEMTVTWEDGSPTYKAGTNQSGLVSTTHNRLGPFSGQPVHFKGTGMGGTGLIYRYRLNFDQTVEISSIIVHGAAWREDYITLLDENMDELVRVDTSGGNSFQTFQLTPDNGEGKIFYLEEYNTDTGFRYRSNIDVDFSVVEPPPSPSGDYDMGYEAGQQACQDNPADCDISVPPDEGGTCKPATLSYDFQLHIPLLHYTPVKDVDTPMVLWVDFEPKDLKQLLFQVAGYGEIEE